MILPQESRKVRRASGTRKAKKIENSLQIELAPFASDELATFEEFEALSKLPASSEDSRSIKRFDKPDKSKPKVHSEPVKKKKRRQIDPSTCERDYNADELEFMNALSEYKRVSGRMFPTCSEILEVLKSLGYEKKIEQALPEEANIASDGVEPTQDNRKVG